MEKGMDCMDLFSQRQKMLMAIGAAVQHFQFVFRWALITSSMCLFLDT